MSIPLKSILVCLVASLWHLQTGTSFCIPPFGLRNCISERRWTVFANVEEEGSASLEQVLFDNATVQEPSLVSVADYIETKESEEEAVQTERWARRKIFRPMKRVTASAKRRIKKLFERPAATIEVVEDDFVETLSKVVSDALEELSDKDPNPVLSADIVLPAIEGTSDTNTDIHKLINGLEHLDRLLWQNGTLWDVAREFTGRWNLRTSNVTADDIDLSIFPFLIRNVSLGVRYEGEDTDLARVYGDFEVNFKLKKLELRFDDMSVLGIRKHLTQKRIDSTLSLFGIADRYGDTETNATAQPFTKKIETNETSSTMRQLLGWFDEWYLEVSSDLE